MARGVLSRVQSAVQAFLRSDAPPGDFVTGADLVDAPGPAGVRVSDRTALTVSAVLSSVKLLSESISTLPLMVFEREANGDRSPAPQHPVSQLLHTLANDETTAQSLRETAAAHVLLRGTAYMRIARDGGGVPRELWPIHPDTIRPFRDTSNALRFEVAESGNRNVTLRPDQVWRIPGLSWNGVTGLSPIGFARETFGLAIALDQNTAAAMKNGARISGVVSYPEVLEDEEYQSRKKDIAATLSGPANAGKVWLADGGAKWEPMAMTFEDLQFLELKRFQIAEVARIFRVPLHMLYDQAAQPRANMEQASLEFVVYSLRPWLIRFEQTITRDLLLPAERARYFAEHNVAGLLRGDFAGRMAGYAQGRQWGWWNVNDIRRMENLNGIGPEGDVYLQPSNMAPAGDAQAEAPTR